MNAIETYKLTKKYGDQRCVSDLNMHVKRGTIYGLLGRNGAGKTTTMKMMLNLVEPTAGEVRIFGENVRLQEKRILPRIGSLIESPGFYPNLTGTENLKVFARLRGVTRIDAVEYVLKLVNLPYKDKKLYSQYSLGMKQRLAIALSIMHDPEILILDEPINGLDPIGIAEIRDFIGKLCKEKGKTILISSHILSEIAVLANDIGILDHGILIEEGSMKELEERNEKYIHIYVSDNAQAARVLAAECHLTNFKTFGNHEINLYDTNVVIPDMIRVFIREGIEIFDVHLCEDTLEEYFKKVTEGKGIA